MDNRTVSSKSSDSCRIRRGGLAFTVSVRILALAGMLMLLYRSDAQTSYGSVNGTIVDNSGAAVSAANVTLTSIGTSGKQTLESDSSGNYRFVNLLPGGYRIDIEKSGFKRLTREPIQVEVQSAIRIDAALQVGDVNQVVEVTAETPLLQTEHASLNQVVEGRTVQEMPLNGRNVLNLIALVPGVVPQGSSTGNPMGNQSGGATTNPNGWGNYQIGGGMANQSATFIDGAPINVSYVNSTVLVPTQDAIQEFRVATNDVSAEFGRFAGGVVNMATKSGTNAFHGSLYEYFRNTDLNANNFFNNRSGLPRPAFNQNQYGANIGGPIMKDKTFFFFGWENFSYRQGVPTLTTVPTATMRAGDFSAPGLPTIYDPLTVCGQYNNPSCPVVNGAPVYTRQAFPGNVIPSNRFDSTANTLKNFWGAPNLPGLANNFATNSKVGGDQSQYNARVDHSVSDKQRLFARYTYWNGNTIPNDPFQNKTSGVGANYTTHQAVAGDTYSLTPTTIADVRASYLRFTFGFTPPSLGADLSQFGPAYAALQNQVTFPEYPGPVVQGMFSFGGLGTTVRNTNNIYSISGNLTKIAGRHTVKFGGEIRRIEWNYGQTNFSSGTFNFTNAFTAQNPLVPTGSGFGFASFLLGNVASGQAQQIHMAAQLMYYAGLYVTDTFQVNNKLTLTYAARWDYPGQFGEKHNSATVLLPGATDPLSQQTGLALKGQVALVNSSLYAPNTIHPQRLNLFAPRIGVAYRLTNSFVLRTGYAITYLPNDVAFLNAPWGSSVNSATTTMASTLNGGITPAATLSNPFPNGVFQAPGHNPAALSALSEGGSPSAPVPDVPYPYAQQWNINLQKQLSGGTLLEVGYGGSKGTHLPLALSAQLNQLPDQYDALGTALVSQVANPFYKVLPTTVGQLSAATVSSGQLLRPYPQYLSFTNSAPMIGDSTYHSLQGKIEKRFKAGGTLLASYTWSKLVSNTDTLTSWLESSPAGAVQDWNNIAAEKSLASYDVPHRVVISYVLDLPVGHGKRFLGGASGLTDKVISGWGINGVSTFQGGFPLVLTAQPTFLSQSFGAGTPRPNVASGCNKFVPGSPVNRLNNYFNTSCFNQPGSFAFGSESRTDPNMRSQGINNFDFAVFKDTALTERMKIQFRTEFFNLFNRVQFNAPGGVLGTPQFGVVTATRNQPRLVQFALRLAF